MDYKLFTPAICISLTSLIVSSNCGRLTQSADDVPLRPPGWVFAIVWPLLYATMGIGWSKSNRSSLYWIVLVGCCSWLYVYSCPGDKVFSSVILVSSSIISWLIVTKGSNWDIPLAIWLSFASYLNIYDAIDDRGESPIIVSKCSRR